MRQPTPADAAPAVVQRQQLVAQAMEHVDDIEALPLEEQVVRLGQVQELLSGVLNNVDVSQLGIPGVG
ncbi:MAG: hypothetical protein GX596_05365 [Propionibacterium sp.]|nr:hypothetical protein [Propionibacterium sp.]